MHGYEGWTSEAQLLAHVIDLLLIQDYHQLRIGGSKSARKPKPVERPWDRASKFGSGAIPYDEIDAWVESTWTR